MPAAGGQNEVMVRPLAQLPKAHLHLHFTGSMRHSTLVDLAGRHGVHLPDALVSQWPPQLSAADERGWFRFQRLYDIARSVVRTEADVARLLLEAAQDERADGSGWLEIQIDPSGYAGRFGGLNRPSGPYWGAWPRLRYGPAGLLRHADECFLSESKESARSGNRLQYRGPGSQSLCSRSWPAPAGTRGPRSRDRPVRGGA